MVLLALIKVWPIIQLQTLNAKAILRGEKRDDLHDCQKQVASLRHDLDAAINRIHQIEMKMVGTVSAYRILETDADQRNPLSPALAQARAVFREVWDVVTPPADMLVTVNKVN